MADELSFEDALKGAASPTPPPSQLSFEDALSGKPGGSQPSMTPHTDEAVSEGLGISKWLKSWPDPPWMRKWEDPLRETLSAAPQFPVSPDSSEAYKYVVQGAVNPALQAFTLPNAALAASWIVPPVGAALTAATLAPAVKPWWQQVKRLEGLQKIFAPDQPPLTPAESLKLGMQTWPILMAPFFHPAKPAFEPVLPRPGAATEPLPFGPDQIPVPSPGAPVPGAPTEPPETIPTTREIPGVSPYAIQPSNAQIQAREAALGVETRPPGEVAQPGGSDYAVGEAEGATAGELPQESVASSAALARTVSEGADAQGLTPDETERLTELQQKQLRGISLNPLEQQEKDGLKTKEAAGQGGYAAEGITNIVNSQLRASMRQAQEYLDRGEEVPGYLKLQINQSANYLRRGGRPIRVPPEMMAEEGATEQGDIVEGEFNKLPEQEELPAPAAQSPYFIQQGAGGYGIFDRRLDKGTTLVGTPSATLAEARKRLSKLDEGIGRKLEEGFKDPTQWTPPPSDERDAARAAAVAAATRRLSDVEADINKAYNTGRYANLPNLLREKDQIMSAETRALQTAPVQRGAGYSPGEVSEMDNLKQQWSLLDTQLMHYQRNQNSPRVGEILQQQKAVQDQLHAIQSRLPEGDKSDIAVVGDGPVGLAVATNAKLEGLQGVRIFGKGIDPGGASRLTSRRENVMGGSPIGESGKQRTRTTYAQAMRTGAEFVHGTQIAKVERDPVSGDWIITDAKGQQWQSRSVVAGSGLKYDPPKFKGAELVHNADVDAAMAEAGNKPVLLLGGGNSTGQAAMAAAVFGKGQVYVMSRSPIAPEYAPGVKMSDYLSRQLYANPKVTVITGDEVDHIEPAATKGGEKIAVTKNGNRIPAGGITSYFGGKPISDYLPDYVLRDADGRIRTNLRMQALMKDAQGKDVPVPGLFVGGDMREQSIGRVSAAEGDGQVASKSAHDYIASLRQQGKLPEWRSREMDSFHAETAGAAATTGSLPTRQQNLPAGTQNLRPGSQPTSASTGNIPSSSTRAPSGTSGTQVNARGVPEFAGESTTVKPRSDTEADARVNILIDQQKTKPQVLNPAQFGELSAREKQLQGHQDAIAIDQIDAHNKADMARVAENDLKLSETLDKLQEVRAAIKAGTPKDQPEPEVQPADVSLDKMMKMKRLINKGRPLTPFEEQDVQQWNQLIKDKMADLDAYKGSPDAKGFWDKIRQQAEDFQRAQSGLSHGKLKAILPDPKYLKLAAEVKKAQGGWIATLEKDRRAQQKWYQKWPDTALKWRRAEVISGIHSIYKLASATIEGMVMLPTRELFGTALKQVPFIRPVAERAPVEGYGFNIRAESAALGETYKNLISDWGKNISGQKPDFESVFGKVNALPPEMQNYVGYLHSFIKSPLARNEFTRAYVQAAEQAARHGVDITDPLVQMELGRQGVENSVFWRFQNRNMASNVFRQVVASLQRQGWLGQVSSRVAQGEIPVVTVPSNVVARTFEGVFGTIPGLARLGRAYYRGIETLKPAEADLIMRNLKTGSFGLALTLLGVFNPAVFGGFYRAGKKKDPDEPGFGATRIPGTDFDIPAYLQDNPFLILPQFGATLTQVAGSYLRMRDEDTAGVMLGLYSAVTGALSSQPYVREAIDVAKTLDPRLAGDVLGEHARSYIVPMAVQQIAEMMDPVDKRYPRGAMERIMYGIPGLREQIPETLPPQQQLGVRRRGYAPRRPGLPRVSR